MKVNLADIKSKNIPLLYEQAFLHFISNKNNIYYYPTIAPKENNGVPVPIYRTIIHNTKSWPVEYIIDVNNLSFRPEKDVISFGRANRPLQSYFYASGECKTCFSEVYNQINEELKKKKEIAITTGQWILQRDINVCVVPDFYNTDELMSMFVQRIKSLSPLTAEQMINIKGINGFFREKDNNSNIYQVTSAFCNAVLHDVMRQNINTDGFFFTSVQNEQGYNLALSPKIITDKDLVLSTVSRTRLYRKDNDSRDFYNDDYELASFIDTINGQIIWKKK